MKKHIIEVNQIRLYAFHGCLDEEAIIGSDYTVDVYIETDFTQSTISDELVDTVDYVTINQIVKNEMAVRAKLLEHVAQRIVNASKKACPEIEKIRVKISKLCPPINGDVQDVSIIIEEAW
jgi:7,8-dihydroneopterin aldolase/epimerase/oxygenase